MQLNNIKEVEDFLNVVSKAKGDVWIDVKDSYTGKVSMQLSLKSSLSKYVALAELIKSARENPNNFNVELFCALNSDEQLFYEFFEKNEDTL